MAVKGSGSVASRGFDPSTSSDATKRLMRPNAQENPDTVKSNNSLKPWMGKSGNPKGPFGLRGREF